MINDKSPMCGIDQGIEYLETLDDEMAGRLKRRLAYIRDKDVGVKPKFHKGQYGKKYDYWTCGNCGATLGKDVLQDYCYKCGYAILWDNPRCLTGCKRSDET